MFALRPASPADAGFLGQMLAEAVDWRDEHAVPRVDLLADPAVSRYVAGWMRPSDGGVVATEAGRPIGAAWFRILPAGGAGWVARGVPELTLGVRPLERAHGVGRALLRAVVAAAGERGHRRLSLAVAREHFAHRLLSGEGFAVVGTAPDGREVMVRTLPSTGPLGAG